MTVHVPETCTMNDDEDQQIKGVAEYFKSWPGSDVKDWPGSSRAEFGKQDDEGGCWTGGKIFPFWRTSRASILTSVQCKRLVRTHFRLLVLSQIVMAISSPRALLGTVCLEFYSQLPILRRSCSSHLETIIANRRSFPRTHHYLAHSTPPQKGSRGFKIRTSQPLRNNTRKTVRRVRKSRFAIPEGL